MRDESPSWVDALRDLPGQVRPDQLSRLLPPPGHERRSAVLILFGSGASGAGPDVLLTERAGTLRAHAGQVAFPGGVIDPGESATQAALREAAEETGVVSTGVEVLGVLPTLYLPVTDYSVIPVLGHWRTPGAVAPMDPAEVARVERVPVAELVDPSRRFTVLHPSGFQGPGFAARGLFVWGFTAGVLDRVLALAGWEEPWDSTQIVHLRTVGGQLVPQGVEAGP